MAVFLFATGPIQKVAITGTTLVLSLNNRTTATQSGRFIVWDMSSGTKVATGGTPTPFALLANTQQTFTVTVPATVTNFEVETRFPDPHQDLYLTIQGTATSATEYKPGEFFQDSTAAENP
jgi:hypothetical protein